MSIPKLSTHKQDLMKYELNIRLTKSIEYNDAETLVEYEKRIKKPAQVVISADSTYEKIAKLEAIAEQTKQEDIEYSQSLGEICRDIFNKKKTYNYGRSLIFSSNQATYISENEDVTPLLAAAERGQYKQVEFILAHCPKDELEKTLTQTTSDGSNALHLAIKNGHLSVVALICEYCKINKIDLLKVNTNDGNSPLSLAVNHNHSNIMQCLIENGANKEETLNISGILRNDAIIVAAESNNAELMKMLIDTDPKLNALDLGKNKYCEKETALHIAAKKGYKEIVELLCDCYEKANLDVDFYKTNPETGAYSALHLALINGHEEVAKLLIQKGASLDEKDANNKTGNDYQNKLTEVNNHKQKLEEAKAKRENPQPLSINALFDDAKERCTQYHSLQQCCARRINKRIAELNEERQKSLCFTGDTKRKKIAYLTELRTLIETSQDTPTQVIANYKNGKYDQKDIDKYHFIISGTFSKKSSNMLESILSAQGGQTDATNDHKFLIERDAAHAVIKHLKEQITNTIAANYHLNANNEHIHTLRLALTQLDEKISDQSLFHTPIKDLVDKNTLGEKNYNLLTTEKPSCQHTKACNQLMDKLKTLEDKGTNIRMSMQLSR